MPSINNQIGYPLTGEYKGTILMTPAVLPSPDPLPQIEPNIIDTVLSSTGTRTGASQDSNIVTIPNLSFGIISVPTQTNLIATKYMTQLNLIPGNNITITTNASSNSVIISSTDTGVTNIIAGNSINVETANNSVTITNTMTETVYIGGNVSGNLTPDRNNGTIQKFTLTDNITLNTPNNMSAGQSLTLILTQDSSGNRLLDADPAYLFASGYQTLSSTANAIDMMNMFYDGTTYYVTLTVSYL